jgi:hypothetical protein
VQFDQTESGKDNSSLRRQIGAKPACRRTDVRHIVGSKHLRRGNLERPTRTGSRWKAVSVDNELVFAFHSPSILISHQCSSGFDKRTPLCRQGLTVAFNQVFTHRRTKLFQGTDLPPPADHVALKRNVSFPL